MALEYFYHYTTEEGYESIKKDGVIKASRFDGNDAFYGEGVYLTRIPPDDKDKVAKNNWGTGWRRALKNGKLDYCIQISLPMNKVTKEEANDRDIYRYQGDLLLKKEYNVKGGRWEDSDNIFNLGTTVVITVALIASFSLVLYKYFNNRSKNTGKK